MDDIQNPGPSKDPETVTFNWTICILCQKDTKEPLQCPAHTKRKDVGAGYKSIAEHLVMFQEINALPWDLDLCLLDNGTGIEQTLISKQASWHKSCRNKIDKYKLGRKKRTIEDNAISSPVKTRRSIDVVSGEICMFCDQSSDIAPLHQASTLELDSRVRHCATELCDWKLLAKLGPADMIASEIQYHAKCLTLLYRRHSNSEKKLTEKGDGMSPQDIALADLVNYMETTGNDLESAPVFILADLSKRYINRVKELGGDPGHVHSTRLKEQLLSALPEMRAHNKGRDVLLVFEKDIGNAVSCALDNNLDTTSSDMAKVASMVRNDIFQNEQAFDGTFLPDCQESSIPSSLKTLISMILDGPNTRDQPVSNHTASTAAQTIAQLITFNTVKSRKKSSVVNVRHNKDKETPVAIYLAIKIHTETRKRTLVDAFHQLGLCISYDRLLEISSDIANSVCAMYEEEGVVCPPTLQKNLFTTAAIDNIDHNPSSITAKESFHGTSISLMQHPTMEDGGIKRDIPLIGVTDGSGTKQLPQTYTNVEPAVLRSNDPLVPPTFGPVQSQSNLDMALEGEYKWLDDLREVVGKEVLSKDDFCSWSAYHASKALHTDIPNTIISLLPLLTEKVNTVATILHGMNVAHAAVQHVNPGQVPVVVMDLPLFAIAKKIQWNRPQTHGENQMVVMFGGLHIEMTAFKALGKWVAASGWTTAITNAGIASSGVADSFIHASHLTRTRHAHQVTAAALYLLQHQAYAKYLETCNESPDFKTWCSEKASNHPQFQFWSLVLEFELTILQLVHAIRNANFSQYQESLMSLIPWMFALDQVNYARWLAVHIRDMSALHITHPAIHAQFCLGSFVAHKSNRVFSSIALDQAHEQVNALVKGEGGAVGLTENPSALRRWMVAGPEIARMVQEFE